MKTIRIELDFLIGPIIKDVYDLLNNKIITGISVIDNNDEINILNDEISKLYSSMYEFDISDKPCSFNYDKLNEFKPKLIDLINKLKDKLNEVNDGSFIVEDLVTSTLLEKK